MPEAEPSELLQRHPESGWWKPHFVPTFLWRLGSPIRSYPNPMVWHTRRQQCHILFDTGVPPATRGHVRFLPRTMASTRRLSLGVSCAGMAGPKCSVWSGTHGRATGVRTEDNWSLRAQPEFQRPMGAIHRDVVFLQPPREKINDNRLPPLPPLQCWP